MKTTTINTLATKYRITFDAARIAIEEAKLTPISELAIGKRTYKLYDSDAAEVAVAECTTKVNKKRQERADKRISKLSKAVGAAPSANAAQLRVIEDKLDAILVTLKKLEESSLAGVEFA